MSMTNDQQPKDVIGLAELHSSAAAAFSYEGLKEARQRAATLLVVLLSGGGGLGGLGLTQWPENRDIALAALAASAYWFSIAAYLSLVALRSTQVRSWHTVGLVEKLPTWEAYATELCNEGVQASGIDELRKSAVRNMESAAVEYQDASTPSFKAIDHSFVLMAATPVVAIAAVVLTA
jgi:hypothetical protein